jgi:hypothetical protein
MKNRCLNIRTYYQGMSHYKVSLHHFTDPMDDEKNCDDSPLTFEDLCQLVFSMKRKLEYQEQEIKELKKGQRPSVRPETPLFPELLEKDLVEFLEADKGISSIVHKYEWPAKMVKTMFMVHEGEEWVLTTEKNQKAEAFTERLRYALKQKFEDYAHRTKLDTDNYDDTYPRYCNKLMSFKVNDVKKAFKSKLKMELDA